MQLKCFFSSFESLVVVCLAQKRGEICTLSTICEKIFHFLHPSLWFSPSSRVVHVKIRKLTRMQRLQSTMETWNAPNQEKGAK